ncbi:MAG: long-chain fatty acid--CoA ligase [Solirubrobacteraceae bacterium]
MTTAADALPDAAARDRAFAAATVCEAFQITAGANPGRIAARTPDDAVSFTWGELAAEVERNAAALAGLGLGRGDTFALMLVNRPEFYAWDLAAMHLGATSFSIYNTLAPDQIRHLLTDAGNRIVVTEAAFAGRILAAQASCPDLEHVVVIDADIEGTLSVPEARAAAPASFGFDSAWRAVAPDDLLTLIYTSGTTGPPKGVELSHANMLALARGLSEFLPYPPDCTFVSMLPMAHIAERGVGYYMGIFAATSTTTCADPKAVLGLLPQVRPTLWGSVPRIWEKLKAGIEAMVHQLPEAQRAATEHAIAAATRKVALEQAGEPVPDDVRAAAARADEQVLSKIRAQLGLDRVEISVVGAAATAPEVLEFFYALGVPPLEVWGMSETTAISTCNPPERPRIGTVGQALPGIELRLADDGELLVRGPTVMRGYRNLPETTAETIDPDGWLHTGDIAEIADDGFVKIVDRKKELIINAAGKNMSPANIEGTLKASSPLIGQACAIGDGRPYNTALIVLDADVAPAWAGQQGISFASLADLAGDDRVRAAIQAGVDAANAKLARVEGIKRFVILPEEWLPGGDELTPTMKLKRKPITEKYQAEIERLYAA